MAKISRKSIQRVSATNEMRFANALVTLEALPPASRTSLRATAKGATAFKKHLGFALPAGPAETMTLKADRFACWLGPDEWLIIDEKIPEETMVPIRSNAHFSAVDISHRNIGISIEGDGCEAALNIACPRDLSIDAFPVGSATRTVFGKAEIVLCRTEETSFRLECWRSFAPYVWALLQQGARDATL